MKQPLKQKPSLQARLIVLVCLVTLLPFVIGQIINSRRFEDTVGRNFREQARLNLQQAQIAVDASLASYDDLLYQLYTDDVIVSLVDDLLDGVNVAVSRNQLRREIQARAYAKPDLQAITLILEDGSVLYYDKLTASATRSSWLGGRDVQGMFTEVAQTNSTHYFSTAYAMDVNREATYLFHIAHRVIDYRNIQKRRAIVVVSVDERLLFTLCNEEWSEQGSTPGMFRLLLDSQGQIVSAPRKELIGQRFDLQNGPAFSREQGLLSGQSLLAEWVESPSTGWTLYQLQDQSGLYVELARQQSLTLWIMIGSVALLVAAIVVVIRLLTSSIGVVTGAMKRAGAGDLSARVPENANMPQETAIIAKRFNAMMDEIGQLMNEVKEAGRQQRDAEIAALEAQINPHFLYNTLDTINWMAIDNDEYDISNAISALASILRYGIDGSGRMVTVRDEADWLRRYLSLQQIRLKNSLDFRLDVEEDALKCPIHKLLFQPFVENAVIHGFEGVKRTHVLSIAIKKQGTRLSISIEDNGKGMTHEQVRELFEPKQSADKHHLGVQNALSRIRMYYGDAASVTVHSKPDEGTQIELSLPMGEDASK